jgi:hypothetical protein
MTWRYHGGQGLPLVKLLARPEPFFLLEPYKQPAYLTKSAYVEPKSGRV